MALGISQRDIQNYETPTVTAVIPPVSQAEVVGENIAAPFKGVAGGVESAYQTLATGATSLVAGMLPSREQMFAAANAGMPPPEDIAQLDPEQIRANQAIDAAHAMANLRPDPRKSGTAAQVLYGLTSGTTRFIAGTAAAGPLGGAALVGTTEGTMTRDEILAATGDRKIANMLGLGSGVFAGTAALLPGGFGSSLASRVTSGAAAQLTLGVSQREMMSSVLADAGYKDQAAQYRPLDGAAMMADAVLGATFGLVHHAFAPPEAIDSAHTIKDSQQIERSAGGPATDTVSRNAVVDNAVQSAERLIEGNGDPPPMKDVRYVPDAAQEAAREATAREADSAAAEAGAERVEAPVEPTGVPEFDRLAGEAKTLGGQIRSILSRAGRQEQAVEQAKASEGEAVAKLSPETQEVLAQAKEALSRNEGLKVHDEEGNPIDAPAALQREMDNVKNAASDGELAKVAAACFGRG